MKKILISAALTGIAVTAGIFLLQEYRKYEFRSAIADAEEASSEARLSEYQRKNKAGKDCLGEQFYLDLIANNINSRFMVKSTATSKCGWIDDSVGISATSIMEVVYEFELVDVAYPSPEFDRQNKWTASYVGNGFEVGP
jgi:hypothetical protein